MYPLPAQKWIWEDFWQKYIENCKNDDFAKILKH